VKYKLLNMLWHNYIQGVSWLVDIIAGGDFLGPCDKKSPYKPVSDFGRLRSYGHFLIPVHALVWTASYQLAGDVLNLEAYRLHCKHYFCHLTRPPIYRQVFKDCEEGGVGGYSLGPCILLDAATTMCSKTLIPCITVTVSAPDVQSSTAIVS